MTNAIRQVYIEMLDDKIKIDKKGSCISNLVIYPLNPERWPQDIYYIKYGLK